MSAVFLSPGAHLFYLRLVMGGPMTFFASGNRNLVLPAAFV
jgi:hypothetical protein